MSDLRAKLIRLAHANPELRKDLLPLLKGARATSPARKEPSEGEVIQGPWGNKDEEKSDGDAPAKKRKDLASTPEAAKKMYEKYKKEHPKTNKQPDDFLDPDAQTDEDEAGGAGEDQADQADQAKENKKPYKPKRVDPAKPKGTPAERLQAAEDKATADVNKKYEKHRGEDGEFPPEIQERMDQDFSKQMEKHVKAEDAAYKKEVKAEKDKLTGARTEKDKADREAHSDALLEKLKEKHGDDKVAIADAHKKGMDKYDAKIKKKQEKKNKGVVKTLLESYNKWKNLTKTWLNPESNPIINQFKGAGTIRLSTVDAGIKARVVDRHASRAAAISCVVFRHRVAMVDERLLDRAARALMYSEEPHKYLTDDGVSAEDAHLAIRAAMVSYMADIKDYVKVAKTAVRMKNWDAVSVAMASAVNSLGADRLQPPKKALALKLTMVNGMAEHAGEGRAAEISRNLDEIQTALDAGYPFTRRGRSLLERRSR